MSKPKNMTPEQEADRKEKARASNKAYRKANREKVRAWAKAWRESNLEKERVRNIVYRKANLEKARAKDKAICKDLKDGYVARLLCIPVADCPPSLIELKRQQLILNRATKELKKHLTEATE